MHSRFCCSCYTKVVINARLIRSIVRFFSLNRLKQPLFQSPILINNGYPLRKGSGLYHLSNKDSLRRTKLFPLRPTNYRIQVGAVQGYENNRQPAIRVQKKGSFGSAIARGLMMNNLTVTYHRNLSIDRPSLERELNSRRTRRNYRGHLPVVPERPICPQ